MAKLTTNYKLVKPETTDKIDPKIFADNFDTIDTELKKVDTEAKKEVGNPIYAQSTSPTSPKENTLWAW